MDWYPKPVFEDPVAEAVPVPFPMNVLLLESVTLSVTVDPVAEKSTEAPQFTEDARAVNVIVVPVALPESPSIVCRAAFACQVEFLLPDFVHNKTGGNLCWSRSSRWQARRWRHCRRRWKRSVRPQNQPLPLRFGPAI